MGNRLFAGGGPFPGGPRGGFYGGDTGVSVLAIVLHFTIWVLVLLAIVWLAREVIRAVAAGRHPHAPPLPSPAMADLEMLYARGEITRTDYLTRRADLSGVPQTIPPA